MLKFFQKNRCAMPLIFLLIYGIPLTRLLISFNNSLLFYARLIGLISFLNVFAQVMLGSFRVFFKKLYKPVKVYAFHNYLGLITLVLSFIHGLIYGLNLAINHGIIALVLMSVTVIISDLKYFFKINVNTVFWRVTHLLNYALFPLLFVHALRFSLVMSNLINYCLFVGYLIVSLIAVLYKVREKIKSKQINA